MTKVMGSYQLPRMNNTKTYSCTMTESGNHKWVKWPKLLRTTKPEGKARAGIKSLSLLTISWHLKG